MGDVFTQITVSWPYITDECDLLLAVIARGITESIRFRPGDVAYSHMICAFLHFCCFALRYVQKGLVEPSRLCY